MTIQQHASFDSSAAELNATSKLVKAWETKNARNAAKVGGISMMALSLAACGGSSTTTEAEADDAAVAETPDTTPVSSAMTTSADALVGGAGADSFSGLLSGAMAAGSTVQSGDSVTGGAGADTLTLYVSGDAAAAFTLGGIITSGVETIAVSNYDTDATANGTVVDMSAMSGVETVQIVNSSATGDTKFDNVQNLVDASVKGAGDANIAYTATVVAGAADVQNVTVDAYTGGLTVAGVETLNITASGANSTVASITAAAATKVTVAGDKNLTITDLTTGSTVVATVDASSLTGKLTVTSADADLGSFTGGSGNDTLVRNVQGSDTAATDSFDGGAGVDTLKVTDGAALNAGESVSNLANYSNFERLELSDAGGETAIDLTGVSMFSIVKSSDATNATTTVNGVAAGTNFEITGMNTAASDHFTAALADDTAADATTVTLGTTAAGVTAGTLTFADHETISIVTQGGASSVNSLVAGDLTTLNVSGGKNFTLTAATATSLATLDASDLTGKLIMSAAVGKTTIAITGGSGADTIIGGSGANTINAGAGNDTITSVEGVDTISGGAGNDTIVVDDFSDLASTDTIDGGDGTDTLKFSEAANHDFTASSTLLNGVSNIEKYAFNGLDGTDTVTINDTVMNNGSITITFDAANSADTNALNAAGVLTASNTVNFTDNSGDVVTYTVGNGIDVVNMGADNDIVNITVEAYASTSDSVNGGVGSDTLQITLDGGASAAAIDTIATSTLSGYSSFETVNIDDAGGTYIGIVVDDTFVTNNELNDALTIQATDGTTVSDTVTTMDASGVTLTTALTLTGGSGVDTISGGAGADVISGGNGADVLTGGAGKDDFNFDATGAHVDVITDLDLGTSATTGTVDQLDVIGTVTTLAFTGGFDVIQKASTDTHSSDTDVVILDATTYATAAAAEDAAHAFTNGAGANTDLLVVWADSFGKVHFSVDDDDAVDAGGLLDYATITSMTLSDVAAVLSTDDFIVA